MSELDWIFWMVFLIFVFTVGKETMDMVSGLLLDLMRERRLNREKKRADRDAARWPADHDV